ncbi:group II intron reverse transcriptase/maturase [Prolixibacteraceae bacterium Z1-6]|uniref:Group II intron reverse transcriptase/maturase n=1 Tax=Draconibacterium aestuarii TaxID=2998507 RepID=A0A9X3F9F7_9BACT|nr:group II intron reverse transcriptase/maturase [Prolixibacteraceae bacterium Z1-6]
MIEQILSRKNLLQAMSKVQKNHGSAGVDRMPVTRLSDLLAIDKKDLTATVRSGKYLPQAILGVEIPKGKGKTRLLGIPTVTDRLLQQAVLQVITARFEYEFSNSSFGFRPNRSVQQAVLKAQGYINEGFQHIVDIDLQTFFDEVDHSYLLQLLYRKIKCRETLRLIRKWLRSPIQINGKLVKRRKGVPQGSPLSPLLSNIVLHELDRELERQGLRFVRYADDFSIYLKTKTTAQKVGNNIFKFLKRKLKLSINREKSGIRRPVHFTCLGFDFVPTYKKGERGKYQLVVSETSWKKLKQKLKVLTRKTTPMSFDERIEKLNEVQRGWINAFRMASIQNKLVELDGWLRNRLRYCIWHHWKKPERKRKNLIRLGIEQGQAHAWSRSRMGGWRIAQSPILGTTITVERLRNRGYISLLELYNQIKPNTVLFPMI